MRRSSPDAPQGIVPVLTLVAALLLVIGLTAGSFASSGGGDQTSTGQKATSSKQAKPGESSGATRPTSTLIYGQTTLFVATTTPFTTTSSTTTTTTAPSTNSLSVRPTAIVFEQGSQTASFTVRSTSTSAVTFFVIGLPAGMVANPATGSVTGSKTVRVNLILTDPSGARSGSLTVVGTDGSEVKVPIQIIRPTFAIGAIDLQPSPPRCNLPSQISVAITGDVATQVNVQLSQAGGGGSSLPLFAVGDGTWQGTLPAAPQGTSVTGMVTATNGSGRTAVQAFGYVVGGGQGC